MLAKWWHFLCDRLKFYILEDKYDFPLLYMHTLEQLSTTLQGDSAFCSIFCPSVRPSVCLHSQMGCSFMLLFKLDIYKELTQDVNKSGENFQMRKIRM